MFPSMASSGAIAFRLGPLTVRRYEGIRLDSFGLGGFRVAQLASVAGVMVAVAGLAWARPRASWVAGRGRA